MKADAALAAPAAGPAAGNGQAQCAETCCPPARQPDKKPRRGSRMIQCAETCCPPARQPDEKPRRGSGRTCGGGKTQCPETCWLPAWHSGKGPRRGSGRTCEAGSLNTRRQARLRDCRSIHKSVSFAASNIMMALPHIQGYRKGRWLAQERPMAFTRADAEICLAAISSSSMHETLRLCYNPHIIKYETLQPESQYNQIGTLKYVNHQKS